MSDLGEKRKLRYGGKEITVYEENGGTRWYFANDLQNLYPGEDTCSFKNIQRHIPKICLKNLPPESKGHHKLWYVNKVGLNQLLIARHTGYIRKTLEWLEEAEKNEGKSEAKKKWRIGAHGEKITEAQRKEAAREYMITHKGESCEEIGKRYGVSRETIRKAYFKYKDEILAEEEAKKKVDRYVISYEPSRDDWRSWCRIMVERICRKTGGENRHQAFSLLWSKIYRAVEDHFDINLQDYKMDVVRDIRANKRKSFKDRVRAEKNVSILSIVDQEDAWMRFMMEEIGRYAKNIGIDPNIAGIPMVKVQKKVS